MNLKHGMNKTKFYKIWQSVKSRCNTLTDICFMDYGGRGIKLDEKWLDFTNFKEDMYASYLEHVDIYGEGNTSIDRINNNGNYELTNCRWATWQEQGNNRRTNVLITFMGKTMTKAGWARHLSLTKICLINRLKRGWSLEKALQSKKYHRFRQ